MARKIIALSTLLAFLLFSWACVFHTVKKETWQDVAAKGPEKAKIVAFQKKSGEYVKISADSPARIRGEFLDYEKRVDNFEIETGQVKELKRLSPRSTGVGWSYVLTTLDGKSYKVISYEKKGDKYICDAEIPESVPLADVDLFWIKKVNMVPTVLVNALLVVAVAGAIVLGTALSSMDIEPVPTGSSCLLAYSFDGENYICDAEPYGGAICRGLQRTEWSNLDHLKDVKGQYRILTKNDLDETQHLDELKLAAVDHPAGVSIVPGITGKIHTISLPLPPSQARDGKARDILPLVSKNDDVFWLSRLEEKDQEKKEDLKEELVFEFPKPANAKEVKVVADTRTTMLGSISAKSFLKLYGQDLPAWIDNINNHGPAYQQMMSWYLKEELYLLQIRVETGDGWKIKGVIYGGGPFISGAKAYPVDVSDVEGDRLRIKLTPASGFWMIDSLAVDCTPDLPVKISEIEAVKAVDQQGKDIQSEIKAADRNYFVMSNTGDSAEFIFPAPPKTSGLERTLILKASGFYEIHTRPEGEPQQKLIGKLYSEPGFSIRYALKENLKWQAANKFKISPEKN